MTPDTISNWCQVSRYASGLCDDVWRRWIIRDFGIDFRKWLIPDERYKDLYHLLKSVPDDPIRRLEAAATNGNITLTNYLIRTNEFSDENERRLKEYGGEFSKESAINLTYNIAWRSSQTRLIDYILTNYYPDMTQENKNDSLRYAVNDDKPTIARLLLDRGADASVVLGSAVFWATSSGRSSDMVNLLLDRGADPNYGVAEARELQRQAPNLFPQYADNLPIVVAAKGNNIEVTRLLLEHGADPNIFDARALRYAIKNKNDKLAQLLLDYGADPVLAGVPIR